MAVAAGADQAGVGPAVDLVEHRVVAAVKKVFELPAEGCQVFGGGEKVAVGAQHVVGACITGVQQAHGHLATGGGAVAGGLGHLEGAARHRVVDDE